MAINDENKPKRKFFRASDGMAPKAATWLLLGTVVVFVEVEKM
jgi:hypothetical protein